MGKGTIRIGCMHVLRLALLATLMHIAAPANVNAGQPAALPDTTQAAALVRSTLLSLNEANLTANYSVLRDGSAPDFRLVFTEGRLASIFEVLRSKHVDFASTTVFEPTISSAVYIATQNVVLYRGTLPPSDTSVLRIEVNFSFAYQFVDGRWRLFKLDLSLDPPASGKLRPVDTAL